MILKTGDAGMLREIHRNIPRGYIAIALILYLLVKFVEGFMRVVYRINPNALPAHGNAPAMEFCVTTLVVLGLIALAYGVVRAVHFHPALANWTHKSREKRFAAFLRTTPWSPSKRLPWGSPLPGSCDLVVVTALMLLAVPESPSFLSVSQTVMLIPACFAAGYAGMSACFEQTRVGWRWRIVAVFLIPTLLLAPPYPAIMLLLSAAILVLASAATNESLKAFRLIDDTPPKAAQLGWPFDSLTPRDKSDWWNASTSWSFVLWMGWSASIIVTAISLQVGWEFPWWDSALFVLGVGGAAAFLRILPYATGVTVYLRTRLITRRWIVPEIDALFLPSLAVLGITGLSALLIMQGIPAPFVIPPFIAATAAFVLLVGPDPFVWRLTCQGNLRPIRGQIKLKRQPMPGA
jgi:hypothetical protein